MNIMHKFKITNIIRFHQLTIMNEVRNYFQIRIQFLARPS